MPPDTSRPVDVLIEQVRRRRVVVDSVETLALAVGVAALAGWLLSGFASAAQAWTAAAATGSAVGLALFSRRRRDHTPAHAARAVERLRPESRNVIVTAEELWRHPERATAWMRDRVQLDAGRAAAGLSSADVVDARRAWGAGMAAILLSAAVAVMPGVRDTAGVATSLGRRAADALLGRDAWTLQVSIRPPAYSRLTVRAVTDPERIEALEGSRLTLTAKGQGPSRVRFGTTPLGPLGGDASVDHVARESGYFAIEQQGGTTRLVALTVVRDRAPSVKIEQPARDLLLSDTSRAVPLRITASDDLALSTLELRYTKVSGSGENFEFQEGTLPLTVTRGSDRDWRAQGNLSLAPLNLAPGDSLVYRAVARDARSGDSGLGASDTFYVEIAGPGQVPLEGIEMPPEEERYALSQQMIVLKIERLRAREATLSREALVEETALLAAEQRSVRANFIFLLGGHVEDEEVEAEQSSEIAEGRLQNTARRDINQAIGHMTRTEQGLVAVSASTALPPARAAVESLQRAFGRSRYLLRSLASRSRLDPSRRLTGNVSTANDWRRTAIPPDPRDGDAIRALLADAIHVYESLKEGAAPPDLGNLAERALAIDPASAQWQGIAQQIQRVHEKRAQPAESVTLLERVIADVVAATGTGLVPAAGVTAPRSPLERAWRDGGGR